MTAKPKPFKNGKSDNSYLDSNQNTELEKKVDAMLSVESDDHQIPVNVGQPQKPTQTEKTPEAPALQPASSEIGGAPLLPNDALPNLESAPKNEPEPQPEITPEEPVKKKFYEPSGPKPVAPKGPIEPPETPMGDELGLEDPSTKRAVDEIVAAEADELLSIQDNRARPTHVVAPKKKSRGLGAFFKNKYVRTFLILLMVGGLGAAAAFPTSRYYLLNAAGVRSGASVVVLDEATGQPLKNAEFTIAGSSIKSEADGVARLDKLKLGPQTVSIKKPGFAEVNKDVTLGWGSNPLGDFRLKPVGSQYSVKVVDFLSKKPLAKIEATNGDASSLSNDKGEIILTIPSSDIEKESIEVSLQSEGLRTEKVNIPLSKNEPTLVEMVPARKHAFISKRSGTYDVYKIDADGKNEEKVLSGTGNERPEVMALSAHPTKNLVALVSSREVNRNKDGVFTNSLTLINLDDNKATKVTQSERIQMVGWVDNRLAYVKIAEGSTPTSPDRHRLVSYDVNSTTEKELANTNYFNDVLMAGKFIYYTPSSYSSAGPVGLFKTNIDGSDKKTIYDKEVWNLFRTSFEELSISMGQEWYTLNLNNDSMARAPGAPAVLKTRVYVTNPTQPTSLWTEERDGKGVMLSYNKDTKEDSVLQAKSGIKNPLRWLTDKDIIYRVSNSQETADYIVSTDGGEPRKVQDVTDTAGIDRWYYY